MSQFFKKPVVRLAAISLLLGSPSAWVRWQVETVSPARLVSDQHPRSVRVVLKDSTEVLIADPVVRSDSIIGVIRLTADVVRGPYKPIPVAVAIADVASVSVATVDTRRTLLLLGATGIAAVLILLLIT